MKKTEEQGGNDNVRFTRSHKKRSLWTWVLPLAGVLIIIFLLPKVLALLEG